MRGAETFSNAAVCNAYRATFRRLKGAGEAERRAIRDELAGLVEILRERCAPSWMVDSLPDPR